MRPPIVDRVTQHLPRGLGQEPAHFVPHRFGSVTAPATSPPHRPPAGAGKFLVVVMLLVGLVVAGLQTLPIAGTAPPNPDPSPEASRPASRSTVAGAPRVPSSAPGDPLADSRLYPLRVSGECPQVRSVTSRDAYTKQVSGLLGCLETIFEPLIAQAGGDFGRVRHQFYGRSTTSPCGASKDAYAFYCEQNSTIYLSDQVYDNARYARLVVADVVVHEYGHHVQAMMGMFDAAEDLDESRATIVRREELQVFCWTYYVFAALPSFELGVDDHSYFREIWGHTDDPEGHGSVKAQQYWGARGLAAENLGACNTWAVPADRVR